jgi:Demethylmenaquinone methyltransferase
MQGEIIDRIRRNRISTTEVADCLGKSGVLAGVLPINRQKFVVGPVRWVYGYEESNWAVHEQLRDVARDEVVLVELFDCHERAIFGSLVAKFVILYKQAAAIAVMGNVRDAHTLIKEDYPIWARGVTPIGCYNRQQGKPMDPAIIVDRKKKYDGAVAVCDDSGVVIIPPERITREFFESLELIEEQEDIWFDCIDRKKWDTFETVCLKKYQEKGK